MKQLPDRPLYLAALAIGLASMVVGAVTLMSDLQEQGVPGGGSVITLLLGVVILAMALTGPSGEDEDRPTRGGNDG